MKYFFIVREGKQLGPFSLTELKEKQIPPNTLVWNEELPDWKEARNIEELKTIYKNPPPIPKKQLGSKEVESEVTGDSDNLNKSNHSKQDEVKRKTANEIKKNLNLGIIALLIGIAAFIFSFYKNDGFTHMSMRQSWERLAGMKSHSLSTNERGDYESEIRSLAHESFKLGKRRFNVEPIYFFDDFSVFINYHDWQMEEAAKTSSKSAALVFLSSFIILVSGRYLSKGAKWVNENADTKNN